MAVSEYLLKDQLTLNVQQEIKVYLLITFSIIDLNWRCD